MKDGINCRIIIPTINSLWLYSLWEMASKKSSMKQATIHSLSISNTRFMHSFLFKQEEQQQSVECQTPWSVKHVPIELKVH